eukprot:TRINITY_DN6252_c2_g1_i1.p1 TRINITY_DN6252_c2_g1~~TRINITY_DN6252_c2_g1_i1.p1  ORF type:complete len:691 (-),score=297.73 TRINITY_DN6252_c2_g1_i1:387-2459(-)
MAINKADKQEFLVRAAILSLVFAIAFFTRLFSVLRFESVIHEFDPYFNYRCTQYLVNEGFYNFLNWFDETAWYPLGRIVGGTVYPGLMLTAGAIYWILHFFNITIQIRNVCVLLAPFMASNTAMVTYLITRETWSTGAGLVAAFAVAIIPGYISRSVAGSYDNEGIAIFALIATYYFWIKALKTGSSYWAGMCALFYFYMVAAWGGYVFIINLIPLHVLMLVLSGRYSPRLYVAYSSFYVLGTLLSMQIRFVGFQPVQSGEHMAAFGMFGVLQLYAVVEWVRSLLARDTFERVFRLVLVSALSVFAVVFAVGTATGYITPFTGRFYSLLDPTYAKEHIPIIASVSEHQPTTWASYFFDLHVMVFFLPAGLYFCFSKLNDANMFLIVYGVTSVYFSGVMVRLILVLAPITCILGGIGFSSTLKAYMRFLNRSDITRSKKESFSGQTQVALVVTAVLTGLLVFFSMHCVWVTSEAYSSPSIVLAANQPDGSKLIFDDFREAYYWLRQNTPPDTRIMSWWDYGYQLAAMANRTVLVDNNTWNNSHIAQVGKAMASPEDVSIEIMRQMDVDYVLVIFGGLIGYSSDDINKFLWMIRIAGSTDPSVKEADYFTKDGQYEVSDVAPPAMTNSLMYKMSYYRFGEVVLERGRPSGFDRVRHREIGVKDIKLKYLEEAYTTVNWLVRLYRVKEPSNRA